MLGIDELGAKLPNAPLVHEALPVRADDGLATRLGDMVGVSRATTRFDAHTPALTPSAFGGLGAKSGTPDKGPARRQPFDRIGREVSLLRPADSRTPRTPVARREWLDCANFH